MKIFVTFLVASTMTLASADISLIQGGYNYNDDNIQPTYYMQQPMQYHVENLIPPPFISNSNQQYLPPQQQQQQQQNLRYIAPQQQQQQHKQTSFIVPKPANFPATFNFQPAFHSKPHRRYRPRVRIPKKPIVTKNFFIHSAPEESDAEIAEELADLQQQPRKHYNVLFVKTPSQTNKAAALNLAKAIKEEKTVVYVLAKKTSASDLQDAIQQAPQVLNKPEVYFIKYRTPEEAASAQQQIQSQYDILGGSTTITDEGIAPATSVIGSLDASAENDDEEEEEQQQQQQQQLQQQQSQQLENSQEYVPQQEQQQQQQQPQSQYDEQQLVNDLQTPSNNAYLPPAPQF